MLRTATIDITSLHFLLLKSRRKGMLTNWLYTSEAPCKRRGWTAPIKENLTSLFLQNLFWSQHEIMCQPESSCMSAWQPCLELAEAESRSRTKNLSGGSPVNAFHWKDDRCSYQLSHPCSEEWSKIFIAMFQWVFIGEVAIWHDLLTQWDISNIS